MVVFSLQAAMAHRHDVGATDFFSGKQTRQERVEGRERVMQHATRKTHDRSFIEIGCGECLLEFYRPDRLTCRR